MTSVINLKEKFRLFDEIWTPKIVAELNGQQVKLAKFKGEMVWHSHENEDEFFFVVKGSVTILLRSAEIVLDEGEAYVVPRGVEHKPMATEEAHVMLFEPGSTLHTGSTRSELTVDNPDWI